MFEVSMHDGARLQVVIKGEGPAILLPVRPWPVEGPQADEMRKWGADPALGRTLIDGLSDRYRVIAFDYEGHVLGTPKPLTLTPDRVAADFLAIADAAGAARFAYYGYSWLALAGMQLALRTDRLGALIMGGYPPLGGPYKEMLQVTMATHAMSGAGGASGQTAGDRTDEARSGAGEAGGRPSGDKNEDAQNAANWADYDWSTVEVAMNLDQTRQFVTLYEALQDFDDRAVQALITCPRLCFAGTSDRIGYGAAFGGVTVDIAGAFADNREALEAAGWEVRMLEGLDHTQAMQAVQVLPLIKPWLDTKL